MGYEGAVSQLALDSTPGYWYISDLLQETDVVNIIYFPDLKKNLVIVNNAPKYVMSNNQLLYVEAWPLQVGVYYAEFRAGGSPKYLIIRSADRWLMYTQEEALRRVPESGDWFIDISIPMPAEI